MCPALSSSSSDDSTVSVDTQDALDVMGRIDFIVASLAKAGVPADELARLKQVINQSSALSTNDVDAGLADTANGRDTEGIMTEGALEKLQQGVHGFAPVWRPRWIRLLFGEIQIFESSHRPEPDKSCQFSLPLSVQQTRLDPGNDVLCKKLGKESILMVSSTTAIGGTTRCVTLAFNDDLSLRQWMDKLEKAMSQEGQMAGASIFRASQTGDILRVKELIARGVQVNRANAYGCVPLHYAVRNAAECAAIVARGSEETSRDGSKMKAQEALRVVVFLMSYGADARAANNVGETPMDIVSRVTSGFPKARKLLVSILDSSKYEVSAGTIFIVPGQPQVTTMEEESVDEDIMPEHACPPVCGAGGVRFSPSRRNRRARKEQEVLNSRRPPVKAAAATCSFGRETIERVSALPSGDHETMVGGGRHCLAADLAPPSRGHDRGASRCASAGENVCRTTYRCARNPKHGGEGERAYRNPEAGVLFKDFRMGRRSAMLVSNPKQPRVCTGGVPDTHLRPATCPMQDHRAVRCRTKTVITRPTTTIEGFGIKVAKSRGVRRLRRQWDTRGACGKKMEAARGSRRNAGPSVPDSEVRRQISEWLRQSVGTVSVLPPSAGHSVRGHLVETSSFVATGQRSDVYKALRAIKGEGQGELISAEKLQAALCRKGQPLLPEEMNELLREADPCDTGYVSCSKLAKLISSERLAPLPKGKTYNDEDDVVLHAKARRLARANKLKIAER